MIPTVTSNSTSVKALGCLHPLFVISNSIGSDPCVLKQKPPVSPVFVVLGRDFSHLAFARPDLLSDKTGAPEYSAK
jgi:hypothetical protein